MCSFKTLFLILAVVFHEVVSICCDGWDGNCSLIGFQVFCYGYTCKWKDNECVKPDCADYADKNACSLSHGRGVGKFYCKYDESSDPKCVPAAGVCSDWSYSSIICDMSRSNSGSICVQDGSNCREAQCSDYNSQACNHANDVGGRGKQCKWESGACIPASSCADFTGALISDCEDHAFNDIGCLKAADGTTCKSGTCADLPTGADCDSYSFGDDECASAGSGKCKAATSCSDFKRVGACNHLSKFYCDWNAGYDRCEDGIPAVCTDYNDNNDTCKFQPTCYPLISCPYPSTDSSSVVSVSALLIILLLMLFW